ncbi:MAG: hypothetical protein ABS70_01000 [Nitrospira sp. SCN 59-13]|nr:MAG: hypothetical protein ABS70_01000 [Nitrospira sp. SCN 59-13]
MKCSWFAGVGLLLTLFSPSGAQAKGDLVGSGDPNCFGSEPKNATFVATRYTYIFSGSCNLAQTRLAIRVSVPWTGVGTFDPATGQAAEDILVPPPKISEPSRPYGRFKATMRCSADPWLNPTVQCDQIVPTVDAPLDRTAPNAQGYRPEPLAPNIVDTIRAGRRPFTSFMNQDAVNSLNRRFGAYQAQNRTNPAIRQFKKVPGILGRGIEQGDQPSQASPSVTPPSRETPTP